MKKIIDLTHFLIPVFLGLIAGGLIAKNKSAWIAGLVLLVLDSICGIYAQYRFEQQARDAFFSLYTHSDEQACDEDTEQNDL